MNVRPRSLCTFGGCGRPHRGLGLCGAHWLQQHLGKPLRPIGANEIVVDVAHGTAEVILRGTGGVERGRAIVDLADVDLIKGHKWHAVRPRQTAYACSGNSTTERFHMHRVIMAAPEGMEVDHIDGNGLNNRRSNLRLVTLPLNAQNQVRRGRARLRNVYWIPAAGRYRVELKLHGRVHRAGYFDDVEEAIEAARALRARHMTHNVEQRHELAIEARP